MNKLSVLFILIATGLFAQKTELTLESSVLRQREYYGESLYDLQWISNTDKFSYLTIEGVFVEDLKGNKKTISVTDLNSDLAEDEKLNRLPYPLNWVGNNDFIFTNNGVLYKYNITNGSATKELTFNKLAENIDYISNGTRLAYTVDNNLFIADKKGDVAVTNDDSELNIVNGQVVHRNEFGISKGTYWSPKGDVLAYYRKDESMVTDYPLVNIMERTAKLTAIKYPMAGMESHHVKVILFNVDTKKKVEVVTGEPKEQYLTNIAWGPDQKYIYIAILNRDQNHVKLNKYSVADGSFVKTLLEETNDTYVQPLYKMEFIPGRKNEFLWRSEKGGFDHFYRYNTDGKLLNKVSDGNWEVDELVGFNGNNVFFTATDNQSLDRVIYKSSIKNNKSTKLSKVSGVHSAKLSASGKYILDSWNNLTTPNTVDLLKSTNGKKIKQVFKSKNTIANVDFGEIELGVITSADGVTKLNTRTIYPEDFNPNKKYPALVYLYNGPSAQLITNSWLAGTSTWLLYLANQGYIVFTVDGRGSDNRGVKFEHVIHKNLGVNEMKDQLKGVEYLKSLKYIDANRLAIHGWSYGGFMTANLMTSYPDVFTTGVAGGPVVDWQWYEIMYGERYMDTPEMNPEGYENSSLLPKVKNLKGKLLMIHGAIDPIVVLQHSMRFIKQSVDDGIQVDYFVYPQHEHGVGGKDRLHLIKKMTDYIIINNQ
ncbi:MAG: DPP IV N-terminal domain-containing protein [Ichthyobacteriaceae bacterium]|nr:DPP IV N-terminal domain-containing protein [Ichthyobacteriaceae bacterium]